MSYIQTIASQRIKWQTSVDFTLIFLIEQHVFFSIIPIRIIDELKPVGLSSKTNKEIISP